MSAIRHRIPVTWKNRNIPQQYCNLKALRGRGPSRKALIPNKSLKNSGWPSLYTTARHASMTSSKLLTKSIHAAVRQLNRDIEF